MIPIRSQARWLQFGVEVRLRISPPTSQDTFIPPRRALSYAHRRRHEEVDMHHETAFRRTAGITVIASALGVVAASVVLFAAVDFVADVMAEPGLLLTLELNRIELFRWGSYLELFAPTLLMVPAAIYLWYWLKAKNHGLITVYTVSGLASLFMAAVGAVLRATAWPVMINAHAGAVESQAAVLASIFQAATDFSFGGLWALEQLLWGVWWLGIGWILRSEKTALGIVTTVLGAAFLIGGTGWILDVSVLARMESASFFVPIWAVWLGVVILRQPGVPTEIAGTSADEAAGTIV
jgi:hypothetical protein